MKLSLCNSFIGIQHLVTEGATLQGTPHISLSCCAWLLYSSSHLQPLMLCKHYLSFASNRAGQGVSAECGAHRLGGRPAGTALAGCLGGWPDQALHDHDSRAVGARQPPPAAGGDAPLQEHPGGSAEDQGRRRHSWGKHSDPTCLPNIAKKRDTSMLTALICLSVHE